MRRSVAVTHFVVGFVVYAHAARGFASDSPRPRVPPLFPRAECLTVVDRAEELFVEVSIPYEDNGSDVELEGARSLEFFAACREPGLGEELPPWTTWDDVERARELGLVSENPNPEQVAETSSRWPLHSCLIPVSGRRIPTTCEDLEGGVPWDPSDVPIGNYTLYGYLFAPPTNVWTRRPGIVRVVDGSSEPGPAVTLYSPWRRGNVHRRPGIVIEGCAAGDASTRVELSWASLQGDETWTTFAQIDAPGSFDARFEPPEGTEYDALIVRAVAVDDRDREWVSYANAEIIVLPGCGPADPGAPAVTQDACGLAEPAPAPPPEPDCATPEPTPDPLPGDDPAETPDPESPEPGPTDSPETGDDPLASCAIARAGVFPPGLAFWVLVLWCCSSRASRYSRDGVALRRRKKEGVKS